MNYGEEFVKLYNEKFEEICSNSITQFESYYSTNYSFIKAEKLNTMPLVEEVKLVTSSLGIDREVYEKCNRILDGNINYYISDITISLINEEVKEAFLELMNKNDLKVTYEEFLGVFAKRQAICNYFSF